MEINLTQKNYLHCVFTSIELQNTKYISSFIYDTFGSKYSVLGTADLLHRIGFVFKKSTGVPCECDIEKQKKFVSKMSKIFKNQDADTVIYYADGVHPTHNCRTTCGWIEKVPSSNSQW